MTPEEMQDRRQRLAKQFTEALPHARALGMRMDEVGEGTATISMG